MKRILFLDRNSGVAYSTASLSQGRNGIGGTEATVVRVARELAKVHRVTVAQRGRAPADACEDGGVRWISATQLREAVREADAVVVLRRISDVVDVRRVSRSVPVYVWYHDWYELRPRGGLDGAREKAKLELRVLLHRQLNATGVCVSRSHRTNLLGFLAQSMLPRGYVKGVDVRYIYNPVEPPSARAAADYDPNKLIYFSAPWKGLDMVLRAFARVREQLPEMKLFVAAPGYDADDGAHLSHQNVVHLGSLSPREVLQEVASSLCVFYPANVVPETFGLVFAESNAVGTPVLAHPFGAAPELLTPEQLVDAEDLTAIVEKVRRWRSGGRPVVGPKEELAIGKVGEAWNDLLFGPASSAPDRIGDAVKTV